MGRKGRHLETGGGSWKHVVAAGGIWRHLEAYGRRKHLEATGGIIWESSGRHLETSGSTWESSWSHLGGIWEASRRHLGGIWETSGSQVNRETPRDHRETPKRPQRIPDLRYKN